MHAFRKSGKRIILGGEGIYNKGFIDCGCSLVQAIPTFQSTNSTK
jgi:hypothetical protein